MCRWEAGSTVQLRMKKAVEPFEPIILAPLQRETESKWPLQWSKEVVWLLENIGDPS